MIHEVYAMGGPSGGGGPQGGAGTLLTFLPFLLIILVFYFLILRPQQKKQKAQQSMLDALKKGDRVVTAGGLHGTITGVKEKEGTILLKVARIAKEDIEVEVSRASVSRVLDKE
ncbi:MAG: preprotein translocase subunit YajC [Candidatus Latescibacteria bacterium]|nr:preprotein translocase subunit YajC [Candidatus Latescibacterota bacterium]